MSWPEEWIYKKVVAILQGQDANIKTRTNEDRSLLVSTPYLIPHGKAPKMTVR